MLISGCSNKKYKVTFNTDGGNYLDSVEVNMGESIDPNLIPVKDGYLFVNWLKDGMEYDVLSKVYEDTLLTANWIKAPELVNDYTITYVTDDYVERVMVAYGTVLEEPQAPVLDDYIFLGWYVGDEKYDFSMKVVKDMVLTAKYKLDTVIVTYDMYDGTIFTEKEIVRGSLIDIPETPLKDGYKFLKWVVDDEEFSFDTKIFDDITLKAIWEKIEYVTITFDSMGGSMVDNLVIPKYSVVDSLPCPSKDGYKFLYWELDGCKYDSEMVVKNDMVLKAVYEVI